MRKKIRSHVPFFGWNQYYASFLGCNGYRKIIVQSRVRYKFFCLAYESMHDNEAASVKFVILSHFCYNTSIAPQSLPR